MYAVMKCCMYQCLLAVPPPSVSIGGSSNVEYTKELRLTCYASGIVERYQWYRNSSNIRTISSTATAESYVISSAQLSDSGSYYCSACNWAGCTSSSSHTVNVTGGLIAVTTLEVYVETVTVQADY